MFCTKSLPLDRGLWIWIRNNLFNLLFRLFRNSLFNLIYFEIIAFVHKNSIFRIHVFYKNKVPKLIKNVSEVDIKYFVVVLL